MSHFNPSKTYLNKKKQIFLKRFYIFLIIFFILFLTSVFLSNYSKINISNIEIFGEDVLSKQDLKVNIEKTISGKYLFFFPKSNIFLFPKEKIISNLKNDFPRILDINIYSLDLITIQVDITVRKPEALWCDNVFEPSGGVSNCYFLDEEGFVFSKAPDFSGNAYFKYYGILPFTSPISKYYLGDREKFKSLNSISKMAQKLEISPIYVEAKTENSFEMYLSGGAKIIFDSSEDLNKIRERLSILIKTDDLLKKEGGILKVDYIDMRFGDKIFYKLKKDDKKVLLVE